MRIAMIAIGSTGDVRPYVLLGRELRRRGHDVTLACFDAFQNMAEAAGLSFVCLPGSAREVMASVMRPTTTGLTFIQKLERVMKDDLPGLLAALDAVCAGSEAVICTFFGSVVYSLAEKYKIPCVQTHYYLMDYNSMAPITTVPGLHAGKLWKKMSYRVGYMFISGLERHYLAGWRKGEGLPAKRISARPDYMVNGRKIPVLYAMSPLMVPRSPHWDENIRMTGFWTDPAPLPYRPDPALERFLAAGDRPIYIGFGSMVSGDMSHMLDVVLKAIETVGARAIISRGWGGGDMTAALSNPNVHVADYVPHDWLFERVSAVVHHGGAGTTAAGIMAGCPTLVIPFGGDQPFWGLRVHQLGLGPSPIRCDMLTADRFAHALTELTGTPRYRIAAAELGERMRRENGTLTAADLIEQELNGWTQTKSAL